MPRFPDAWMGELLSKADLVSLVSAYVPLKPKGGRMWGCCPFHNEKTPSFSVVPDKQFYYCFGCHEGGGAVQFVMEMEKLSYVDAVKWLAQRVGMELPEEVDDASIRQERAVKERIYAANKEAAHYFFDCLMCEQGKTAQAYLVRRGLDSKVVKRFGLGYAPAGWENLTRFLTDKDFTKEELIRAGLAIKGKKDGECYDAFRDRIIFPIIDTSGRVLGFGARTMGDDTPKYINTGDTPVYNKRRHVYGLNLLKRKKLADVIMVEGYMDVIRLVKAGVENTVAGLGTALTTEQARLLKRYVPAVYLCYDGDGAGQNAALRGLDILAKEELDVRVIVIPGEMDPDDYVRAHGAEAFLALKEKALPRNAFKLETMARRYDLGTPDGREGFAKEACALAGGFEPVERERYAPLIARKTGLSLSTVQAQCGLSQEGAAHSVSNYRHTKPKESGKNDGADKTAIMLLSCMLVSKEGALAVVGKLADMDMDFPAEIADFADVLLAAYMQSDMPDIPLLLSAQQGDKAEIIAAAQVQTNDIADPVRTATDYVLAMRKDRINARIRILGEVTPLAGEQAFADALAEMNALQKELAALQS
ncbi:MAG: DNA primase [Clostridia bacterium]|nr:DNA primase [Clostridia bacterium]